MLCHNGLRLSSHLNLGLPTTESKPSLRLVKKSSLEQKAPMLDLATVRQSDVTYPNLARHLE